MIVAPYPKHGIGQWVTSNYRSSCWTDYKIRLLYRGDEPPYEKPIPPHWQFVTAYAKFFPSKFGNRTFMMQMKAAELDEPYPGCILV